MNTTLFDIPVDYSGCESEEAKAQVRVDARNKARKQIATQPDMLEALENIVEILELAKTPEYHFDVQAIAQAAITLAEVPI